MTVVTRFPRRVREIENAWITLADGCRLAARIWLPEDAESDPVPGIVEYLPYRKRDSTRDRDDLTHPYVAGHSYACVRVDMRGNGESDGLMFDEYTAQEHADCLEVIAWIAAQPWCTGRVGMIGISWGGFNGLQVAALRPPALKAVVTLCSTDDRYADDVHYMGGCPINVNFGWASAMFANSSRPPDPELVGDRWRAMWLERLDNTVLLADTWSRHPRRDAYWRHGSVCEDYGAIEAAVYAVGGWADGYSNAIPRLLAGLRCPRKGIIGPWAHKYPHFANPAPRYGFLQDCVRWWDHWLKDRDTGMMAEPMLRVWMQEGVPPAVHYGNRPGRWVAEPSWPSSGVSPRRYALNPGSLDAAAGPETPVTVSTPQELGAYQGSWCPYGLGPDQPADQRGEDGKAVCFDSAPLPERLEFLGAPVVSLDLAADKPNAFVAVRLNDVAPDGASTQVTYGLLNLTHRDSHEAPTPLVPGQRYRVRVQLNDIAHAFAPGHRLRLAVSNTFWPLVWPSPEPVVLTLYAGSLDLPVRPPRPEDARLPELPPEESAQPMARTAITPGRLARTVGHDAALDEVTQTVVNDTGSYRIDAIDLEVAEATTSRWQVRVDDPLSARGAIATTVRRRRGDWSVRTEMRSEMRAGRDAWTLAATLEAFEGDRRVFSRTWDTTIPRDLA